MKITRFLTCLAMLLLVSACGTNKKPAWHPTAETSQNSDLLKKDYDGFTLWLDCKERAAVKFRYTAHLDTGSEPRREKFAFDPELPRECQQTSTKAYGHNYDRGHQVPANHLDHSAVAIKQSNYISNILPQAAGMNRGAWLLTEEITECYRDLGDLLVLGGVIWGDNAADDFFVGSHGVRTPDAFWKVIIRGNDDVIAWIVPNSQEARRENLDDYLVSVAEIERLTGEKFPVSDDVRTKKLRYSWMLPVGCNKN